MFPQLFVDVFSRESPKIVTVWVIFSGMTSMRGSHATETRTVMALSGFGLL